MFGMKANILSENLSTNQNDQNHLLQIQQLLSGIDKNNGGLGSRSRLENSLGELTRKFITMIQESPQQCVDLNDAAKKLDV